MASRRTPGFSPNSPASPADHAAAVRRGAAEVEAEIAAGTRRAAEIARRAGEGHEEYKRHHAAKARIARKD